MQTPSPYPVRSRGFDLSIWGNDLLESHPRLVVGLDFVYGGR